MFSLTVVSPIFHGIALGHHIYSLYYCAKCIKYENSSDIRVREVSDFGPRYITTWNLIIQIIYLLLALSADLTKLIKTSNEKNTTLIKSLQKCKGYLYTVIMFPTTLTVVIMFWTLFWINREWVFPETIELVAPKWVNHSIHTNILIVLFAELFISRKGLPRPQFKTAVFILTLFGIVYFSQFVLAYYQFGRWIYGIFYILTWPQRLGLMLLNHAVCIAFLWIGFFIQNFKSNNYYIGLNKLKQQ